MNLLPRKLRNDEDLKQVLLSRRTVTESGCWEWTGARHQFGYGLIRAGKPSGTRLAQISVHRLSAELWLGMSPDSKLWVLHKCHNPPCFNPEHLFVGTQSDNIRDAIAKGRPHPATLKKNQTHCKHGHEFTPENTGRNTGTGTRICKQCHRDNAMARYRRLAT